MIRFQNLSWAINQVFRWFLVGFKMHGHNNDYNWKLSPWPHHTFEGFKQSSIIPNERDTFVQVIANHCSKWFQMNTNGIPCIVTKLKAFSSGLVISHDCTLLVTTTITKHTNTHLVWACSIEKPKKYAHVKAIRKIDLTFFFYFIIYGNINEKLT